MGAAFQFIHRIHIFLQIIPELPYAVRQLLCAVHQFLGGIPQFIHVIDHFFDVLQVVRIKVLQQPGRNHRRRKIQFKVRHLRRDLHIVRDLDVLKILHLRQFQALSQPWERISHCNPFLPHGKQFPIFYLHLGKYILRKHHHGKYRERHTDLYGLFFDRNRLLRPIDIVKAHLQLPALPRQILRRDLLSVQFIADLHLHRERLRGSSLIMNVFPSVLPEQGAVACCPELLVPLGVFDIVQNGIILDLLTASGSQPGFHCDLLHPAGCICLHLHIFFFVECSGLRCTLHLFLIGLSLIRKHDVRNGFLFLSAAGKKHTHCQRCRQNCPFSFLPIILHPVPHTLPPLKLPRSRRDPRSIPHFLTPHPWEPSSPSRIQKLPPPHM